METYSYYADGKWLEPASGEYFETENPYTGEAWAQIPRCNDKDADLPSGVINTVTGFGTEAGEPLVTHELVRKISFTGSVEGGTRVAGLGATSIKSVWLSTAREIPPPF
jgi:acyl-CoA reductase-like NAD-dependent aldehyde dehydrogenase